MPITRPPLTHVIAYHLRRGLHVAVIAPRLTDSAQIALDVAVHLTAHQLEHSTTLSGSHVTLQLANGATLRTISTAPGAVRGHTLDLAVLVDIPSGITRDDVRVALATRSGSIIDTTALPNE